MKKMLAARATRRVKMTNTRVTLGMGLDFFAFAGLAYNGAFLLCTFFFKNLPELFLVLIRIPPIWLGYLLLYQYLWCDATINIILHIRSAAQRFCTGADCLHRRTISASKWEPLRRPQTAHAFCSRDLRKWRPQPRSSDCGG